MANNMLKVIFDKSDLRIQENLNPKNLKIIFGYEEDKPSIPCDQYWHEIDGDQVNADCSCKQNWVVIDGDQVNVDIDCEPNKPKCDNKWKEVDGSADFDCICTTPWIDGNTDFNIDCNTSTSTDFGRINFYEGQNTTFTIHGLEIYKAYDGQYVEVDLDARRTLLEFNVYDGQSASFNLTSDRQFIVNTYDGQYVRPNVTFATIANLVVDVYEGQYGQVLINTNPLLDVNVYDGQYSDVRLSTYPSIALQFRAYDGQYVTTPINTSIGYVVNVYDGQYLETVVDVPDTGKVVVSAFGGESSVFDLSTEQSFNFNMFEGHNVDYSLATYYMISDVNDCLIGENVDVVFYEPQEHIYATKMYVGENTNIRLNTTTGFIIDGYGGEYANINVEFDPYKGIPIEIYSGEYASFGIFKDIEIVDTNASSGEVVTFDLGTQESFRMSANVYEGQYVVTKPMFTVILGTFNARGGEYAKFDLDETPNVNMYSGDYVDFEIATDAILEANAYGGEEVTIDLKYGEPVRFGTFNAYGGENVKPTIKMEISTLFFIDIKQGQNIRIDQFARIPYDIDLDNRKCCNIFENIREIELADAPYNWTRYDQSIPMCEVMTFDLSTRRAFSFNAYSGEYSKYDNTVNTFEVRAYMGEYAKIAKFSTERHIDIENGNLTPDNGHVIVDIDRPEIPTTNRMYRMYTGESSTFELGVPYAVTILNQGGENVNVDMIVDPALKPKAYMGENVKFVLNVTSTFQTRTYMGESAKFEFYEPPFNAYSGEYAKFALETKSDYYAEFLENGCLDNEYHDIDPDSGQPLPQKHNGANVEGEKFLTYVKGRCF